MGLRPPEIGFMPGAVRNRCLKEITEETGAAVSEIELLTEIKAQLGRARELALGGGWSILLFFIDMAIMETDKLTKRAMRAKLLAFVAEPDGERARQRAAR
jgi:hypothetical protein